MDSSETLEGFLSSHHSLLAALQSEFQEVKQITALAARRRVQPQADDGVQIKASPSAEREPAAALQDTARSRAAPATALLLAASDTAGSGASAHTVEAAAATLSAAFERLEGALGRTGTTTLFAQPGEILQAASAAGTGGSALLSLPPPSALGLIALKAAADVSSPRMAATPQRLVRDAPPGVGSAGLSRVGTASAPPPSPAALLRFSEVREWAAQHAGRGGSGGGVGLHAVRTAAFTQGASSGGDSNRGGSASVGGVGSSALAMAGSFQSQEQAASAALPLAAGAPGVSAGLAGAEYAPPAPAAHLQLMAPSVPLSHLFAHVRRTQRAQAEAGGGGAQPPPLLATSPAAAAAAGLPQSLQYRPTPTAAAAAAPIGSPPAAAAAAAAAAASSSRRAAPASVIAAALRSREPSLMGGAQVQPPPSQQQQPQAPAGQYPPSMDGVVIQSPLWRGSGGGAAAAAASTAAGSGGSADNQGARPAADDGDRGSAVTAPAPPLVRRLASFFSLPVATPSSASSAGSKAAAGAAAALPLPPPPPPPPPPPHRGFAKVSRSEDEDGWDAAASAAAAAGPPGPASTEVDTARGLLPSVSDAEAAGPTDSHEIIFKGCVGIAH